MDYLLHGNTIALKDLVALFQRVCQTHGVRIGQTRATMILIKFLDEAKGGGLLEEVPEASEGCEEAYERSSRTRNRRS